MAEVLRPESPNNSSSSSVSSSSVSSSDHYNKFWKIVAIVFIVLFVVAAVAAIVGTVVISVTKKSSPLPSLSPSEVPYVRELFFRAAEGKKVTLLEEILYFVNNTPGVYTARIGKPTVPGYDVVNNGFEYLSRGYDFSLFVTFVNEADLILYEKYPVHWDFVGKMDDLITDSLIYETETIETIGNFSWSTSVFPLSRELFFTAREGKYDTLLEEIRYFVKNTPGIYSARIGKPTNPGYDVVNNGFAYLTQGLDISLLVTFANEADLIVYEKEPVHWDFVAKMDDLMLNCPLFETETITSIIGYCSNSESDAECRK